MTIDSQRRRQLLQAVTALLGANAANALTGRSGAIAAALAYVPEPGPPARNGQVFTLAELRTLRAIGDQIIPRTDTPSASDIDVHGFVDHQLANCYSNAEQSGSAAVLKKIESEARAEHGAPFADLSETPQLELLEDLEAARGSFDGTDRDRFKLLKKLIVLGYCSSEPGATEFLAFNPFPGRFEGSVPYASVGRAWYE